METSVRRARAIAALISLAALAAPAIGRATGERTCAPPAAVACGIGPGSLAVDQNVVATTDLFVPGSTDIHLGNTLVFQNLDTDAHTVTLTGCTGEAWCDKALPVGAVGLRAVTIPISPRQFEAGKTYTYRCTIHIGMTGSFTVH